MYPKRQDGKVGYTMANFTEEQVAELAENPNVAWVSVSSIQFTPEFKLLAWEQKQQGKRLKEIFLENGIDPEVLGRKRIENFSIRLKEAVKEGCYFADRRVYNHRPAAQKPLEKMDLEEMSLEERVRWLSHELEYTKQEVEFLKKLRTANMEAQKEWGSKHRPK